MTVPLASAGARRRQGGAVTLASAALLLISLLTWRSSPTTPPARAEVWVATAGTIEAIAKLNPNVADGIFRAPNAYALGGWGSSVPTMAWASEAVFAADVRAGAIPSSVRAVMYDPENWPSTPVAEQRDPGTSMRAFANLARRHGYYVIITPHPSLTAASGAVCAQRQWETAQRAYVRCGIVAKAARFADAVETQAQGLEADPAAYRSFVAATVEQARAANPKVVMLSGLSTAFATRPSQLFAAWLSVNDLVDGHYLAIPNRVRPEVAVGFLEMLTLPG